MLKIAGSASWHIKTKLEQSNLFERMAAHQGFGFNLTGNREAERIPAGTFRRSFSRHVKSRVAPAIGEQREKTRAECAQAVHYRSSIAQLPIDYQQKERATEGGITVPGRRESR